MILMIIKKNLKTNKENYPLKMINPKNITKENTKLIKALLIVYKSISNFYQSNLAFKIDLSYFLIPV